MVDEWGAEGFEVANRNFSKSLNHFSDDLTALIIGRYLGTEQRDTNELDCSRYLSGLETKYVTRLMKSDGANLLEWVWESVEGVENLLEGFACTLISVCDSDQR